jgi:hypothetical protein
MPRVGAGRASWACMSSTRLFDLLLHCTPMLGVVAFIAGALWAGILFSVSWLSGRARWMADGMEVGTLALTLNRRWATPFLVLSLTSAFLWMYALPPGAFNQGLFMGVGAALLVLLLVHSSVRSRAARVASGSVSATRGEGMHRVVLVLSLAVLTTLVGLRFTAP